MDLFYLDEQYAQLNSRKFTAVNAAVINSSEVHKLRKNFYTKFSQLLDVVACDSAQKVIRPLPVLHGRGILPGYDDEIKIAALRLLFSEFEECEGRFFRLGYYDDKLPKGVNSSVRRLNFVVSSLLMSLPKGYTGEFAIIHEFEREAVRNGLNSQDGHLSQYYQIGEDNISIPLSRYIGHFFSVKGDLGCQIADLGCFLSLKATNRTDPSEFATQLISVYEDYRHLYSYDDIISVQWHDKDWHPIEGPS